MQKRLLERICCGAGVLAGFPGGQFLEGSSATPAAGCQPGMPTRRHFPLLVREPASMHA